MAALQAPQQFAAFLEHVVAHWMSALVDAQGPDTDPVTAKPPTSERLCSERP
jgi:hypothetical protein